MRQNTQPTYRVGHPYPHKLPLAQQITWLPQPLLIVTPYNPTRDKLFELQHNLHLTFYHLGPMFSLEIRCAKAYYPGLFHASKPMHQPTNDHYELTLHVVNRTSGVLEHVRCFTLSQEISQGIYQASLDPRTTTSHKLVHDHLDIFEQALETTQRITSLGYLNGPKRQLITSPAAQT